MTDALIMMWGGWHWYDASGRGSVPHGTPCVLPTGEWSAGGLLGAEEHQIGGYAAAAYALGNTHGDVSLGNVFAPTRWFGGRGIPCTLTRAPDGAGRAA